MLIVTGVIEVAAKDAEAMAVAARAMVAETVKEEGCHVYEFSQDVSAPGRFRVYEEWQDDACLAAHGQAAHMVEFRAALGEIGVASRRVVKFVPGPISVLG